MGFDLVGETCLVAICGKKNSDHFNNFIAGEHEASFPAGDVELREFFSQQGK